MIVSMIAFTVSLEVESKVCTTRTATTTALTRARFTWSLPRSR